MSYEHLKKRQYFKLLYVKSSSSINNLPIKRDKASIGFDTNSQSNVCFVVFAPLARRSSIYAFAAGHKSRLAYD